MEKSKASTIGSASTQPAILAGVPPAGMFVTLSLQHGATAKALLATLAAIPTDDGRVVGLGEPLAAGLGTHVPGLHAFRPLVSPRGAFPSTQGDLWFFQGGRDAGDVLHKARALVAQLAAVAKVEEEISTFVFDTGRDLTGYEDGSENPKGDKAIEAAVVRGGAPGMEGGSFVAVQRWIHDLTVMEHLSVAERNLVIGRRREDNEEIADAPLSAHVKRTAQESYSPPAFMLRRSMPYGNLREHGLYFVAYGASLDAFERVLAAMAGTVDGVSDALLRYSRPVTGAAYFCPPVREGRLDLRAFGLASD